MTIPNLISMVRLVGAPILLWLANNDHDLAVIFVLIIASASDYLDGKLARILKQQSKLGEILDPDRKSTRLNSSHIPLSRMPSSA